jgi:hypothetical protein
MQGDWVCIQAACSAYGRSRGLRRAHCSAGTWFLSTGMVLVHIAPAERLDRRLSTSKWSPELCGCKPSPEEEAPSLIAPGRGGGLGLPRGRPLLPELRCRSAPAEGDGTGSGSGSDRQKPQQITRHTMHRPQSTPLRASNEVASLGGHCCQPLGEKKKPRSSQETGAVPEWVIIRSRLLPALASNKAGAYMIALVPDQVACLNPRRRPSRAQRRLTITAAHLH